MSLILNFRMSLSYIHLAITIFPISVTFSSVISYIPLTTAEDEVTWGKIALIVDVSIVDVSIVDDSTVTVSPSIREIAQSQFWGRNELSSQQPCLRTSEMPA